MACERGGGGASLRTLDLGLDIVNGVRRLHLEGDGLAREGLDEDLHLEGLVVVSLVGVGFSHFVSWDRFGRWSSVLWLLPGEVVWNWCLPRQDVFLNLRCKNRKWWWRAAN